MGPDKWIPSYARCCGSDQAPAFGRTSGYRIRPNKSPTQGKTRLPLIQIQRCFFATVPSVTLGTNLIRQDGGRIGKGDQFSRRVIFLVEKRFGLGVNDGQDLSAANSPHEQTVALDSDDAVLFVKDRLLYGFFHASV
jgi:hypothetical protein